MNTQQPSSLTISKASAGSGKTFKLATEYIKIVIDNPYAYRNILAVTFTNKATEEMKIRILSQLYGIAHGLSDSESYFQEVKKALDLSDKQIRERAEKALDLLLHNYSYFRVETIDSFFQSVLRNLARELDLTANLRIELNDKEIQEKAVDQLIEELHPKQQLLGWILDFIEQKIADDKSWNVIGLIKDFGNNIFQDTYKDHQSELTTKLNQKGFFPQYVQQLYAIKEKTIKELKDIPQEFTSLLTKYDACIDDLSRKSGGPASYFLKMSKGTFDSKMLINSYVQKALDSPDGWLTKTNLKDPRLFQLATELTQLLENAEKKRKALIKPYRTADLILKNLNQLRLLSSIENKVRELNDEGNNFLLSDTQTLLHELIDQNDSPFIFEKIGTQLSHIMIDEFQDTSTVQWKNFKILLQETMSHQDTNSLIVGDVKQSIYRWRSGDWRLLNNIEQEFAPSHQLKIEPLDTNYRSEHHIVNFNNHFFEIAAQQEYEELVASHTQGAEQMQKAYADVVQKIHKSKDKHGCVRIKLFPKEQYNETTIDEIIQTIQLLLDNGAKENSIAILVRNKANIHDIADVLMQAMPHIKLVSDEAFRLDSSSAVNILVDALHCLTHPEDQLTVANLAKTYQTQVLNHDLGDDDLLIQGKDIWDFLPKQYVLEAKALLSLPAMDLVERLYALFDLSALKHQSAYVCAFYDVLSQYISDNIAEIDSFINQWNETLHEKTIQSDGIDGIRMLTIHKSKGLEFDHVIIPFCDWKLEKEKTLWCKTDVAPFNELPVIPITFNERKMQESYFEDSYQYEHLQNVVDNMNLLYVAFTRACKSLFIFGQRKVQARRSKIIEDSLEKLHTSLSDSRLEGDMNKRDQVLCFSYGELWVPSEEETKFSENVFFSPIETQSVEMKSYGNSVEFRQSNQSRTFTFPETNEDTTQQSYIQLGNVLHMLFSKIKTTSDIPTILRELEFEGVLYDNIITHEKLQQLLEKRLNNPKVAAWFSPQWELYNECSIIHANPITGEVMTHRPDRVMMQGDKVVVVDFKFGKPRPEYHDQIREYIHLLQQMGHTQVTGYLWFVYSNLIEEIK